MSRLIYELIESFRIAFAQIRANLMRSVLTALGVVIGIVAVTLMGTAINGISKSFNDSLALLGEDILYVDKWPWGPTPDWWNYQNRPAITLDLAAELNRVIDATPNSRLEVAVPTIQRNTSIKFGATRVTGIGTTGTTADYTRTSTFEVGEGRFFSEAEGNAGRQVIVLGASVAETLFPSTSAIDQTVFVNSQPFNVIGVIAKQGAFISDLSVDNQAFIPITAFRRFFGQRGGVELRVKMFDKTQLAASKDELVGSMRRVRAQLPGERDNFSINEQQLLKDTVSGVTSTIAIAGLFITGLALFVGAIGIMNITFVSVKERTKEIGTRKALGARRRTILLQFLIEAVSICLVGGVIGLGVTYGVCLGIKSAMPSFPIVMSAGLVVLSMIVSIVTGIVSGFAPALGASRLDPVVALRYE